MIELFGIKEQIVGLDQTKIIVFFVVLFAILDSFFLFRWIRKKRSLKPDISKTKKENLFESLDSLELSCQNMSKEKFLRKLNMILKKFMITQWLTKIDTMSLVEVKNILIDKTQLPDSRVNFFFDKFVPVAENSKNPELESEILSLFKKIYLWEFDGDSSLSWQQRLDLIKDVKNIIIKKTKTEYNNFS